MVRATCDITGTQIRRFNDFVRGELKRRHLTQESLADFLNVTRSTLSYRLNGTCNWYFEDVLNTCQFFGVSLSDILEGR